MDSYRMWSSGRLWPVAVAGLFALLVDCHARDAHGQTPQKPDAARACAVTDVHSRHFLIHTDLSRDAIDAFVVQMEAMLGHISAYWGQPMHGVIECYIIRNLDDFPVTASARSGVCAVRTAGGATIMQVNTEGKRPVAKSVVYALARLEVVRHETVHAYCHQTFGRVGPVWYSEGMAELGRFWGAGDTAVCAEAREIAFLRDNPPKSLAETLSPAQITGDCWQNYASRWALCHFLASNPNYSRQFQQLGRGILAGKDVSFEQTYAATTRQLFFEYLLFLRQISPGYRVDLCAWDWKRKSTCLQPGQTQRAAVAAGRGWQPAGLTTRPGMQYKYATAGTWQIAGEPEAVDSDGGDQGRGRLVGVLMNDYRLGPEFELGAQGSLQFEEGGDLYLRCRNAWSGLAGDAGRVSVTFQCQKPCETDNECCAVRRAACESASCGGQ